MGKRTNEADIAAVTDVVRAYYDGSMERDEAKLARAFHPRACIVGNEHGELYWATLDEYVAECKKAFRKSLALCAVLPCLEAQYKRAHLSAVRVGDLLATDGRCGPIGFELTQMT